LPFPYNLACLSCSKLVLLWCKVMRMYTHVHRKCISGKHTTNVSRIKQIDDKAHAWSIKGPVPFCAGIIDIRSSDINVPFWFVVPPQSPQLCEANTFVHSPRQLPAGDHWDSSKTFREKLVLSGKCSIVWSRELHRFDTVICLQIEGGSASYKYKVGTSHRLFNSLSAFTYVSKCKHPRSVDRQATAKLIGRVTHR
jgi:hypothetical protein